MVFGGCCCHKDLNVAKYGVVNMQAARKAANKANQAVINLSDNPDSAALQSAINSSEAGCIKLLELLGSLLRHKDGEWGYQDKCVMFMKDQKSALFDLQEVLSFHGIIQEPIEATINAKVKSGHPNHIEQNVLKALNDPPTLSELASLALYRTSVSWQYMVTVHGTKEEPVNLLDLTPIHQKLPGFCKNMAKNPHILLNPSTSLDQLTINGLPFEDEILIESTRILVPETENLLFKFHEGGTFDMLTPQQRKVLFLPSTNDHNKGMLGSYRVHMRYHPSSTPESFSNQTRNEQNNTEAFIKKHCDASDHKYVMREVRKFGASGHQAKFRKSWAALQREKAEKALQRHENTATKKKNTEFKIAATTKLKDQLHVYRDVLKDPILVARLWKDMALVQQQQQFID
ncbi:hypothetical protein C8J56DRAFT_1051594 [Mycena floridula]|nr:hypothetical protein C8J56DRAFT_1051594 [Mycena floridula]